MRATRKSKALALFVAISLSMFGVPMGYADETMGVEGVSVETAEEVSSLPQESTEVEKEATLDETVGADDQGLTQEDERATAEGYVTEEQGDAALQRQNPESSSEASDEEEGVEGAEAFDTPLEEGTYLVRSSLADGYVFDVVNGSTENGASVQLYQSNMSAAQRFSVTFDQRGLYTIQSENSGKVLDVANGSMKPGAKIQQYESNGTSAQKWIVTQNENGTFSIASAADSEYVLDVAGGLAQNGSRIQLYSGNGTAAQQFAFIPVDPDVPSRDVVEPGVYALSSCLDAALVVDVKGASLDNGATTQLHVDNGSMAQMFYVAIDDQGYAVVQNVNSGKVLDVASGNLVAGTRVQQWEKNDSDSQRWALSAQPDGSYVLISKANGLALDVQGGQASTGAILQTYTPNGTIAQSWNLVPVATLMQDGIYTLSPVLDSGKTLDIVNGSNQPGASVQVWTSNGTPAQKFRVTNAPVVVDGVSQQGVVLQSMVSGLFLTATGQAVSIEQRVDGDARQVWMPRVAKSGGITLENAAGGLVLDVSGGSAHDGCIIGAYTPNDTPAQAFRPVQAEPVESGGMYELVSSADGRALDVVDASRSNAANVQAWTRNGSGAQAWTIEGVGDGFYRIINARSGKVLDVANGSASAGANVQQYQWNGSAAQKWRVVVNEDCSLTFVSGLGDYALDVSGGGGFDGANVQIYTDNDSAAQKWRVVPTTYVRQDFEDLIGSFTTYSSNTWNGTYNMQKALDEFNGIILQPGESMSFYGVTGRCGAAEGYLPAGVVGGIGYGGGICQASTTIYGAAIRAGFGIVDRQNHSVPSVYVPIGLDAMVSWGSSDLVVRNDTGYPAKIVTYTYDNVLTCEIWGIQADWYDSIEPVSWYTSSSSAAAQRIYYKNGTAVYTEWLPSSYYW